jgi:3-deoxy-7-phosphoheptulonate synthase
LSERVANLERESQVLKDAATSEKSTLERAQRRLEAVEAANTQLAGMLSANNAPREQGGSWLWILPLLWLAWQILSAARMVKAAGGTALRGGAFKPRSSPYSFQGLGEKGLKFLAQARKETGLPIVTEAMDSEGAHIVAEVADCIQIGARNMQNYSLLKTVGKLSKPVLLKRGMAATINELLLSAEYILAEGNERVILCERGVRSFDPAARNMFDLTAIPIVHRLSHLPIIADPSHGTGLRDKVIPMARAAVAAGADGVMIEMHPEPDRALSDGAQSLYPDQFTQLVGELRAVAAAIGRNVPARTGTA